MKEQYLKQATVLVVRRGVDFLVARIPYSLEFRWSRSAYDAWSTRSAETDRKVAEMLGGDLWLFNGITGELREAKL